MQASTDDTQSKIIICYCCNLTLLCHLQTTDEINVYTQWLWLLDV